MKVAVKSSHSQNSLTFFEPLKEENSIAQSGLLQSFFEFFGSKKNSSKNLVDQSPAKPQSEDEKKNNLVIHYKAESSGFTSKDTTNTAPNASTAATSIVGTTSNIKPRSYSTHSFADDVFSRPNLLNVRPLYNVKDPNQGSEVELKSFSTLFRDLPRKISKGNQQYVKSSSDAVSSQWGRNDLRQYWMPDKQCHECYECNERFTTFRRRHHCRICGHIFCSRCCFQLMSGQIIGYPGMVRSCTYCYNKVMADEGKAHESTSVTATSVTEQDGLPEVHRDRDVGLIASDIVPFSRGMLKQRIGRTKSMVSMRNASPIQEEGIATSMLSSQHDFGSAYNMFDFTTNAFPGHLPSIKSDQVYLAKQSLQLQSLWMTMIGDSDGIEFRDHRFRLRKFSRTISGEELVEWLLDHQISTTRDQAGGIGQALLDAELIKNIADVKDTIFHEDCLYHRGKDAIDEVHKYVVDDDADLSSPIAIPSASRVSFEQAGSFDLGNEPNWVREIADEGASDVSSSDEVDGMKQSWGTAFPALKSSLNEDRFQFSDDSSGSPLSGVSLASYIELDNQRNIIKYNRRSQEEETKSRKEKVDFHEPRFVDDSAVKINADYIRGYLSWHGAYSNSLNVNPSVGWRESDLYNSSISSTAKQTYHKLKKLYFAHSMQFLKQLFKSNELEETWREIIVPLAKRISESVVPNCEVNMDVVHYVHVKKLLDGPPQDSRLVNGVVFTKNIVNNKMRSRIDNPAIMLLATPLEYQRGHHKFASIDPVVRQEPEFFKNLTSRILKQQPDIVISQCSVAHVARRRLQEAGITLIINVKKSVMERIARSTGGEIVRSIDQIQHVRLGTCTRFRVMRLYDGKRELVCSDGPKSVSSTSETASSFKTMICLDGCLQASGCTVLLRDSPDYKLNDDADNQTRNLLSKVKSTFLFLVRIMYHCNLELSYLMDQQDLATSGISVSQQALAKMSTQAKLARLSQDLERLSESSSHRERCDTINSMISDSNTVTSEQQQDDAGAPDARTRALSGNLLLLPDDPLRHLGLSDFHRHPSTDDYPSLFDSVLLSFSPLISKNLPYLLTDHGKSSPLHSYLPDLLYWSEKFPKSKTASVNACDHNWHSSVSSVEQVHCRNDKEQFANRTLSHEDFPTFDRSAISSHNSSGLSSKSTNADSKTEHDVRNDVDAGDTSNVAATAPSASLTAASDHVTELQITSSDSPSLSTTIKNDESLFISQNHFSSDDAEEKKNKAETNGKQDFVEWSPFKHPFLTASFTQPANAKDMQDLLADFRANGSSLRVVKEKPALTLRPLQPATCKNTKSEETKSKSDLPIDCLALSNHQHIFVLFSSYSSQSPNAPYPCVIPWAVDIDFYKGNDITLGGFLERYCFRPSYNCPNSVCHRPMVEHIRSLRFIECLLHRTWIRCFTMIISAWWILTSSKLKKYKKQKKEQENLEKPSTPNFVHGTVCMNVVLKELSKPVLVTNILSWCWNPETKTSTDLKTLSQDARSMSFAKYLELRLATLSEPKQDIANADVTNEMGIPPFTSFQYFLFKDIVAAFKCFKINVYDVSLPPMVVEFQETSDWMKIEENYDVDGLPTPLYSHFVQSMDFLSKVGYEVMDSIFTKIASTRASNPFDNMSGTDYADMEEDIVALKSKRESHFDRLMATHQKERCHLRDRVDRLHLDLQSLRIEWEKKETGEDTDSVSDDVTSCQPSIKLQSDDDLSVEDDVRISQPPAIFLDEENRKKFSSMFLELTCLICQLVHIWNERISAVVDQDRQSRKAHRNNISDLYVEQPLTLQPPPSAREGRNKINLTPVEESTDDATIRKDEIDGNIFAKSSSPSKNSENTDLDAEKLNPIKSEEESSPIPTPSRTLEKIAGRRPTRTASTMNMKFLVNQFLSSSNQTPVKNPFSPDEHYLLPNCAACGVVVRDEEPTSIIAYTLQTDEYLNYVESDTSLHKSNCCPQPANEPYLLVTSEPTDQLKLITLDEDITMPNVEFKGMTKNISSSTSKSSILSVPASTGSTPIPSPPQSPSLNSPHVEVQFKDATTKFYCKVYFAQQFKDFRQQILKNREEDYISALSRCRKWAARGGKSGSAFHKTLDDRLVIKQMSRFEMQSFLDVAQHYFAYVTEAVKKKVFDLKGSVRNRHVKTESDQSQSSPTAYKNSPNCSESDASTFYKPDLVLLDENLLRIMKDRPLYVHEHTKILLKCALAEDADFLADHLIIDYSLLVGIDADKQEIVVGIIDYLRTFTWDKKIEMVVKSYGMIGRQGTRSMPTVVSPEMYRNRFCEAMERYFQVAPDQWHGLHAYKMKEKTEK